MSDSYGNNNNNNNFIVRLRGLPWNTTKIEIEHFLQGCKIREINFTQNDTGRATGECFVVLDSQDHFEYAKSFHQKNLGSRTYHHMSSFLIYLLTRIFLIFIRLHRSVRIQFG